MLDPKFISHSVAANEVSSTVNYIQITSKPKTVLLSSKSLPYNEIHTAFVGRTGVMPGPIKLACLSWYVTTPYRTAHWKADVELPSCHITIRVKADINVVGLHALGAMACNLVSA